MRHSHGLRRLARWAAVRTAWIFIAAGPGVWSLTVGISSSHWVRPSASTIATVISSGTNGDYLDLHSWVHVWFRTRSSRIVRAVLQPATADEPARGLKVPIRVSCTRFGQRVICKRRVWPAADGSWPAGAARHDPVPLARLSHRSIAGLALHRLVDAGELDDPDWGWPAASQCAEPVPGLSPGGNYRRGWISQARMRRLRCGRVRPAVGRPLRRVRPALWGNRPGGGLARSGSWLPQLVPWQRTFARLCLLASLLIKVWQGSGPDSQRRLLADDR